MVDRRSTKGKTFEVVEKPQRRSRIAAFSPEELMAGLEPVAKSLPSSKPFAEPEILPPEPRTVDDYAAEIGRLWEDAQRTFLRIGEYLDAAQAKLSAEEFATLVARLPFGKSARSQLMRAYRAIKSGSLPTGVERAGYVTVYQITTLSEPERQQALAQGIIRPDMRREDLLAFKRQVRATQVDRRAELERERDRLRAEVERAQRRLAEIERELGGSPENA